jgi:hypothetical protein
MLAGQQRPPDIAPPLPPNDELLPEHDGMARGHAAAEGNAAEKS